MLFAGCYFVLFTESGSKTNLEFENYLLPFELLYQDVYDSDNKDESLLHLKSNIESSFFSVGSQFQRHPKDIAPLLVILSTSLGGYFRIVIRTSCVNMIKIQTLLSGSMKMRHNNSSGTAVQQ